MGRIAIIVVLFVLLAASAALDFPGSFFADPMPRGLRALDWIVTTLATRPFGNLGGAALFALLGAVVTALAIRGAYGAAARSESGVDELLAAVLPQRRRQLAPATAGADETVASGTKGQIAALLGAEPGSVAAQDQRPAAQEDYANLILRIIEDNQPPPGPEGPLDPLIDAARRRPIVFRQQVPAADDGGLSFYGGRPVMPPGFVWPRVSADPASKPLHFIMQWECCQLAEQDATGLLPKDGVLYFFLDFEWGRDDGFRFIHCPGAVEGWQPLDPPVDLGPVLGDQGAWQMAGCTSKVDDPNDYVPRLMPHAPFTPRSFDYPILPAEERDEGETDRLFWHDKSCAEALLTIEKSGRAPVALKDINEPKPPFERPFAAFPHDFGAIRVLAAEAIDELDGPYRVRKSRHVLTELSSEEREAKFDAWLREARELYIFASQRPMSGAVPQEVADQIWTWVMELEPVFRLGFYRVVTTAVDTSLGVGSEAIKAIPAEQIAEAATMHTLAREYLHDEYPASPKTDDLKLHEERRARGELKKVRSVHAPTPTHMIGPPSYVQGYVEELVDDHLLLLEITSGSGPGHHFGDGVLQYLIRPDDLHEGRFDRVKSVISGY